MSSFLSSFLLHWGLNALSLWIASRLLAGVRFSGLSALGVSALLLGIVNAVVRPLLVLLTLPLTLLTFGLFLPVVNALMLLLVAALVPGFRLSGFWSAFFAALMVSVVNLLLGILVTDTGVPVLPGQPGGVLT